MMINLAREWSRQGIPTDLVLFNKLGVYLALVPSEVRIIDLDAKRVATGLIPLVRYLRRERPRAVLSGLVHVNTVAILAKAFAPRSTRIVVSERNTPSQDVNDVLPANRLGYQLAPLLYRHADGIIAVSAGVADDLCVTARLPRERIEVINNPVVTDRMLKLAREPFPHRWFEPGSPPVILAVGRLMMAKDYPTLLHAFAALRNARDCRLVILGDGPLRQELEALALKLGIREDVEFGGFVVNPYAAMSKAALLVLSSRWEGSPNVVVEAMACGLPVVSTDCPSGPREILAGGRYGALVPVGDARALAAAMSAMLDCPVPAALLAQRSRDYSVGNSALRYLDVLLARSRGAHSIADAGRVHAEIQKLLKG